MADRDRSRALIEAVLSGATDPEPHDGSRALLVFEVAGAALAVDAARVEAVTEVSYIAPVPYAPRGVLGIASVRGRMRVVVDPGGAAPARATHLVILDGDAHLALLVDRVLGVRRVPADELDAPGAPLVLDPDRLVREP